MSKKIYSGFCTSEDSLIHNLQIYGINPIKVIKIRGENVSFYDPYDYNVYKKLAFWYSPECTKCK